MTTITIEKSKLIIWGGVFLVFILGLGLGTCIGAHHEYRHDRGYYRNSGYGAYGEGMMGRYYQNQSDGDYVPGPGMMRAVWGEVNSTATGTVKASVNQ